MAVLLATAGYDHTIKLWEAPSGICHKTLPHPESQVNKLEITPDKLGIAAAGNPSLRLFDLTTGTATVYDGHTNNVTAVGFQKVCAARMPRTEHAWCLVMPSAWCLVACGSSWLPGLSGCLRLPGCCGCLRLHVLSDCLRLPGGNWLLVVA